MDKKQYLFIALLFLGACSSFHRSQRNDKNEVYLPYPPSGMVKSEQKIEGAQESSSAPNLKKKVFGVWVESTAYDAAAALGYLQELEKKGLVFKKIVGTGFGCWLGLSWALENSGNQAEWQFTKWTQWDYFLNSWLSRLKPTNRKAEFISEFEKLFSKSQFSDLKLLADCPVVSGQNPYLMESSHGTKLSEVLWNQLNIPALGFEEQKLLEKNSGLLEGNLMPEDLESLSKDISLGGDEEWGGWIILKTRNVSEITSRSEMLQRAQLQRYDRAYEGVPGVYSSKVFRIRLTQEGPRSPADLSSLEWRRKWLLEGRSRAALLWVTSENLSKAEKDLQQALSLHSELK